MKQLSWPPDKDGLAELRRLKDEGNAHASEMLFAAGTGVLASQEAINWYIERNLACERCGNPATRSEDRTVCLRYPHCFAIDLAKDFTSPWAIYGDRNGKSAIVMLAGRIGDVANVELVPDGVVSEVVRSVNANRMSIEDALGVFRFHSERTRP